jgi:cell shape-determining protein MreD
LFGATTDLIPCAIILICIIEGSHSGSLFALISASLYVFSGSAAGVYSLFLIVFLAVFVCIFRQGYLQKGFASAMLCTVFAVILYESAVFFIGYLLGLTILSRWIGFAVTAGLSCLCAPILYPIILSIASIGGDTWKE